MDEAQIKQLIEDSIKGALQAHSKALLDDVTAYVENRAQLLEDSVRTQTTPEQPNAAQHDESPLTARLALLEKELNEARTAREQQDAETKRLKFESAVKGSVSAIPGILHADMLSELMVNRLANGYTVKDDAFITKNGKTVVEEVNAFIETDAGKHFLAPKQQPKGSDNPTPARSAIKADNARTLSNALLRRQ